MLDTSRAAESLSAPGSWSGSSRSPALPLVASSEQRLAATVPVTPSLDCPSRVISGRFRGSPGLLAS
jgi:hypothetical protein